MHARSTVVVGPVQHGRRRDQSPGQGAPAPLVAPGAESSRHRALRHAPGEGRVLLLVGFYTATPPWTVSEQDDKLAGSATSGIPPRRWWKRVVLVAGGR